MSFFKKNKKISNGFSLIELLVTIAILVVVSGLVFFNHSQFNNHVLVENLAYEISLVIRQAQSYGVQVKQISGAGNTYGVFFDKSNNQFIIFADVNNNSIYDMTDGEGESDILIDILNMTSGNKIDTLCGVSSGGICTFSDNLSITFERPNPDAIIKINSSDSGYSAAYIDIISPKEIKKRVFVNKVGQISVQSVADLNFDAVDPVDGPGEVEPGYGREE
ncbi:MAG: prepilin-type N-terminal cleavage/methylation domain-containing protein [Candidatus Pacebacteria bacterium]|nr:prepilin-type N-terminal cleavage/methylation domain-containing protein [Candidatus Paceibacterota bacterium]